MSNQTAAATALTNANVLAAAAALATAANAALDEFVATCPGEAARRDFVEQANAVLARVGMPGWLR